MIREGALWAALIVLCGGAGVGCATTSPARGDETHFQTCATDADCSDASAGHTCASGICSASDAGAGGSGGVGGSGGKGGKGGAAGSAGGASSGGEPAICHLIDVTNGDSDAAAVHAILGDAATSCVLRASDYDRSCTRDSDCTAIGEGNACTVPCGVKCPSTAINAHALTSYQADYDQTPLATCPGVLCGCPAIGVPHCSHGTCELAPITLPSADAGLVDSGPPRSGRRDGG